MTQIRVMVVGVLMGAAILLGGCETNYTSIHTGLSREQLSAELHRHFNIGMTRDDIRQGLVEIGADWYEFERGVAACSDAKNAFVLDVRPWGLYCGLALNPPAEVLFALDVSDRLACVGYREGYYQASVERIMP